MSGLLRDAEAFADAALQSAVNNSVPPVGKTDVLLIEDGIAKLQEILVYLDERPFLRSIFTSEVQRMASADGGGNRVYIPFPIPVPWPWPPIWFSNRAKLERSDVEQIVEGAGERLDTALGRSVERIFPAILAGLALGKVCGVIYNKLRNSSDVELSHPLAQGLAAASDYMASIDIDVALATTVSRPDYANAAEVLAPSLEKQMSDPDTKAMFDNLVADATSPDRVLHAVVFGACFLLGFASEVL